MSIWNISLLAKQAHRFYADGDLLIVDASGPSVLLDSRYFDESFPCGWTESDPFESGGKLYRIRSIKIDGVTYKCSKVVE